MRACTEVEMRDMPPAAMRAATSCCSHACSVCTRSVGAGEYVPAYQDAVQISCPIAAPRGSNSAVSSDAAALA